MKRPIEKILIANRGEISCRVIKSAKQMGIKTVAVYSDADRDALHVKMADEAVRLGPAPSKDSYLQGELILKFAKQLNVDAIHPGYGFLSENADFCRKCEEQGVIFIGPPVEAIEAMGSKSAAKQIMESAGVPLVPGYHGDEQDPLLLHQHADQMGYPVLLKAAAGGGGKGMRQVHNSAEFQAALQAAKREAMAGFGDDKMLIEKYLTQPRHVEIQVFCDAHGNGVYLFERDCSVQRRHQKVIEEAPAPGMSEALRQQMGEAALKAAKAINYVGAGTVEFLLEANGDFYFMEMNTRLQVEHPVTEMITKVDLVNWQIRVAAGETLPLEQSQLAIHGHAFEARIYAEDPDNDFLPATGYLQLLSPPIESEHVRVDTGVLQGDTVSVYYDPMIAKLIVWDENRDKALSRLAKALSEYQIEGLTSNVEFLYNLATSAPFKEAQLSTHFIEQHQSLLFPEQQTDVSEYVPVAAMALICAKNANASSGPRSPWDARNHWRMNEVHQQEMTIQVQDRSFELSLAQTNGSVRLTFDQHQYLCDGTLVDNQLIVSINGHRQQFTVSEHSNSLSVFTGARAIRCHWVQPDLGIDQDDDHHGGFVAPMNGTIVDLLVAPQQPVEKGQTLLIMEAMKMEHALKAPSAGSVSEFFFQPGDLVDGGAVLLQFEPQTKD